MRIGSAETLDEGRKVTEDWEKLLGFSGNQSSVPTGQQPSPGLRTESGNRIVSKRPQVPVAPSWGAEALSEVETGEEDNFIAAPAPQRLLQGGPSCLGVEVSEAC